MSNQYIDLESGLKRVGNSKALFKRLLGKYLDEDYYGKVRTLLDAGNELEASNAAHTIKGVAANLSLTAVNTAALNLEQALKHGEGDYEALAAELKTAMDETATAIGGLDLS
ncbi:MAG: Hpt domain-containing protein [Oscillospiraceae bacterium]|jgi:HPt (histidine-containing phosphotransfer) domain-containing protein|nr:Hpt domain-containing protein [Oscillospiraceae bacterium]